VAGVALWIVWTLTFPCASWGVLIVEPAGSHSTLPVTPQIFDAAANMLVPNPDLRPIRDDEFARLVESRLVQAGRSNVLDAKFLFQECFGGGMLDDVATALAGTVKWVGGSASRWDEASVGQVSRNENATRGTLGLPAYGAQYVSDPQPPRSFWTSALITQFTTPPPDRPLLTSINNAIGADLVGPNATPPFPRAEHGQSTFDGGGDTIQLKEPDARSYHAILWAGNADAERHFFNIEAIRAQLLSAWGDPVINPNVTITVLFGNGRTAPDPIPTDPTRTVPLPAAWNAQAATRANLTAVLNALPLDPNEQFLFYATDHGGKIVAPAGGGGPMAVAPGDTDVESLLLVQGILDGMLNTDGNVPLLTLDYSGVLSGGAVAVFFNSVLLGYLDPALTEESFVVPEFLVGLSNQISVFNGGSSAITILDKFFDTGGINDNPLPTPEPGTWALLLLGGGVLTLLRRGRWWRNA